MKCHIVWHFIRVFTVCQSTCLLVSGMKKIKLLLRQICCLNDISNNIMDGYRNFCQKCVCMWGGGGGGGGGSLTFFVFVCVFFVNVFHRQLYEPPSRGSVPVLLRKPISTCDFPGGSGLSVCPLPLNPPMNITSYQYISSGFLQESS